MTENRLYYGDNLDILQRYIKDESVDLIYLDPPFNSNRDYNAFLSDTRGQKAEAQLQAFKDTWLWDDEAVTAYTNIVEAGGRVSMVMQAFKMMLGGSRMLAYLSMMAPRLVSLRRVLKPSGSIYLHCDDTANHYLKLLMDAIFGIENFREEIQWKRTSSHNDSKGYMHLNDKILFYAGADHTWNPLFLGHDEDYLKKFYRFNDDRGRYRHDHIIRSKSMGKRPNLTYEYKNYTPEFGWRMLREKVEALDQDDRIAWSSSGRPYLKRYLEEQKGTLVSNIWIDIPPLSAQAKEKLGYPTQKPEKLLERIIRISSNEGDVVLDPFCGCGTAVAVSQRLKRNWIGIDITCLATNLIKRRLSDSFSAEAGKDYRVIGEPTTLSDAETLAKEEPFQFQYWSLGLVGARPEPKEEKRGKADRGIDGRLFFHDEGKGGKTKQIIFSVKGVETNKPAHVRELRGVIERENAEIGVFIILNDSTKDMRAEAAEAGFYQSAWGKHPRIQILTIQDLLDGKRIDFPPAQGVNVTFKQAPKAKGDQPETMSLPFDEPDA